MALDFNTSFEQLRSQYVVTRDYYNNRISLIAGVVGAIVGVVVLIFGVMHLASIDSIRHYEGSGFRPSNSDFSGNGDYYDWSSRQVTPVSGGSSDYSFLIGGGVFGAVGGIVTGIVYFLGWLLKRRSLKKFDRCAELLKGKYHDKGRIVAEDIGEIVKLVDDTSKRVLMQKMDFCQLCAAKESMGTRKFERLLGEIAEEDFRESHQKWKLLLTIQKLQGERLKTRLRERVVAFYVERDSAFKMRLFEILRGCSDCPAEELKRHYFYPLVIESKGGETVLLKLSDGTERVVNKSLLTCNSEYFKAAFGDHIFVEATSGQISFPCEDPRKMSLLIDTFLLQNNYLDKESCLELLPLVDQYVSDRLLALVDDYLSTHLSEFSEEELLTLVYRYPRLARLEDVLSMRYCGMKINYLNWDKFWRRASLLRSDSLERYCRKQAERFLSEELEGLVRQEMVVGWLQRCYGFSKREWSSFSNRVIYPFISVKNVVLVHKFAQGINDNLLKRHCEKFCCEHIDDLKQTDFWLHRPERAIADIVYPSDDRWEEVG